MESPLESRTLLREGVEVFADNVKVNRIVYHHTNWYTLKLALEISSSAAAGNLCNFDA